MVGSSQKSRVKLRVGRRMGGVSEGDGWCG
jgi:hypothetical protein